LLYLLVFILNRLLVVLYDSLSAFIIVSVEHIYGLIIPLSEIIIEGVLLENMAPFRLFLEV
jgi:hypothetical protein